MTNAPAGEEWKILDRAKAHYDPCAHADLLDEARSRIRRLRCREAVLRLVDRDGRPVRNCPVEVEQTCSAFPWGDHLWGLDALFRHGHAGSDRVRHFTRRFSECLNSANCLTYWTEAPRNDGPKHMEFQGEDKLDHFEEQVSWALANGLTPKGHPIFWSIDKAYPEWLKRYPLETQWKFLEVRVRNLVARFKGRVKLWDVVNEPMWEAAPKNLSKRHWPHLESLEDICEYVIPVLRWAREEDPAALFLINDYGMELDAAGRDIRHKDGHSVTAASQRRRFIELFRRLAEEGATPDGLGMQAHTGGWMDPATQNALLDDFASSGVPLHYTEFWAETGALIEGGIAPQMVEEMKAEYIANFLTIAFAHPAVESFFFWGDLTNSFGFKQDHNTHGVPSSSNTPSPTYWRVRKLLREDWMTRESLRSDSEGCVKFRGFLGDYELRYLIAPNMPSAVRFSLGTDSSPERTLALHRPVG